MGGLSGPRSAQWLQARPHLGRARLAAVDQRRVRLTGFVSGDYVVEEERPDGRLVLRPDLSLRAILARHGERELTPQEFARRFGHLPADGAR